MKCPICSSDEIYESRIKGAARYLISFSPVIRYRCQNCWNGFWGFRSPLLKAIYLIGACLVAVAAAVQIHSLWDDEPSLNPTGRALKNMAVTRPPQNAAPPPRPDTVSPPKAPPAPIAQGGGKAAADASSAKTGSEARTSPAPLALHERPGQDAPVVHRLVPDESLSVIHQEEDWLVVALENGTVGWISEADFLARRRGTAASEPTSAAPEANRADVSARPAAPSTTETAAASTPPATAAPLEGVKERPAVLTVSADIGRIRTRPSLESPVLFLVQKNEQMQGIVEKEDWYQVAGASGAQGWAHKSLFESAQEAPAPRVVSDEKKPGSPAPPSPGTSGGQKRTVAVDVAMVRQQPSPSAPIRFRLYGQEKVEVLSVQNQWLEIKRVNGWIGWAHESLFLPVRAAAGSGSAPEWPGTAPTLTVGVDVGMVRTAPSADAPRAFRVVEKMKVRRFEQQGEWVRIGMKNGWTGWAHQSLFRSEQPGDEKQ